MSTDIAPEMADMLRAGAEHDLGIICSPGQVRKLWPLLSEAERMKLIFFQDVERPIITDMGRRAIGAPPQLEADYARLKKLCGNRKKRLPRPDDDPRTDFDYRSYQANDFACVLAVRQPDSRSNPATIRVGRDLTSAPQFLGPKNSIVQPESEGSFVLAVMPRWIITKTMLPTCPFPLSDDEPWTADERALFERLRQVCMSINIRIRRGGNRQPTGPLAYGEYA